MSTPHHEVTLLPDADALAREGAQAFITLAQNAIQARGAFHVALSGGSSPRGMYAHLARHALTQIDWARVHLFFVDERCVPPHHPQSNYGMVARVLLSHVPLPPEQVHRIHGERPPQEAADMAHAAIEAHFGGPPQFDAIFLGMGEDGHTASLFAHSDALTVQDRWIAANYVLKLDAWRVTMTYPTINNARALWVIVQGESKLPVVQEITAPDAPLHYPIQGVVPVNDAPLHWLFAP